MTSPRRILLSFALCISVWLAGLFWFLIQIPDMRIADDIKADAIVVLTGGTGRLEYGFQLLLEGHSRKLFISGVSEKTTVNQLLGYAKPDVRATLAPVAAREIFLGRKAVNTIGNAVETTNWIKKENIHSVILVTTCYHMPRSIDEFNDVMPGLTIIPAPVFPDNSPLSDWMTDPDSRGWLFSEYHKYLAAKLRHWLISVIRHQ